MEEEKAAGGKGPPRAAAIPLSGTEESWCRGTPPSTTGWKGAGRSCTGSPGSIPQGGTSSRLRGRFVRHDSTEENLRVLESCRERWGRPVAFCRDQAGLFPVNRSASREEQLAGEEARTQIGRAWEERGMEWIAAHSPQAQGRVERCLGTWQDRWVKGLRVEGARTLEQAPAYGDGEFLPAWEKRFTGEPHHSTEAHRGLGPEHDLGAILSRVESRVVTNDYTLRFQGQSCPVRRDAITAGLRGSRVRVERRLDGTVAARFRDHYLPITRCARKVPPGPVPQPAPAPAKTPSGSKSKQRTRWMEGFDLRRSLPLWAVLPGERSATPAEES